MSLLIRYGEDGGGRGRARARARRVAEVGIEGSLGGMMGRGEKGEEKRRWNGGRGLREVLSFLPSRSTFHCKTAEERRSGEDDPFVSEWVSQSGSYLPSATGRTVCTVQIRWRARAGARSRPELLIAHPLRARMIIICRS